MQLTTPCTVTSKCCSPMKISTSSASTQCGKFASMLTSRCVSAPINTEPSQQPCSFESNAAGGIANLEAGSRVLYQKLQTSAFFTAHRHDSCAPPAMGSGPKEGSRWQLLPFCKPQKRQELLSGKAQSIWRYCSASCKSMPIKV